jgi:hypothetical protein
MVAYNVGVNSTFEQQRQVVNLIAGDLYAIQSGGIGIATYATTAGISTISGYSTSSGIATYATNAGIATYATSSGIATYATSSGIATYATNAGIATYATSSGISTSVMGGIGSITQLQVTGVSTFTNGTVLIGSGTSTGTSLQRLQVTGGAYVSDNLGVGATNPQTKLEINGVLGFRNYNLYGYSNNIRIGNVSTGSSVSYGYGENNFFAGPNAGQFTADGSNNNFLGSNAGQNNTNGSDNNILGYQAGQFNTSGYNNNFFGSYAGNSNTTGSSNNFFGGIAVGGSNTTGSDNNFFGSFAGQSNTTGSDNIYIGQETGNNNVTGSQNVIIGKGQNAPILNGSNQLVIGAGSTSWITGNSSYNVGIGTTRPTSKLHVLGDTLITGVTTIRGNLNAAGNYYVKLARTTNQTITGGVDALIAFTATSDTNGWYSGITTRTTPTVAGTYRVDAMINWQAGTVTNNQTNIQLRKNGTTFALSQVGIQTFSYTQNACGIVTMNGTSDYIDFTVYSGNPTSQVVTGTADGAWTKMEVFKIN